MKRILVAEDFRACNGKEAVEKALSEKPDLVLMDLKMPVMDGLEATRQLKAQCPALPVIALTANAFDSDRQRAFEAGCVDFLPKPVSATACMAMLAKYLGE